MIAAGFSSSVQHAPLEATTYEPRSVDCGAAYRIQECCKSCMSNTNGRPCRFFDGAPDAQGVGIVTVHQGRRIVGQSSLNNTKKTTNATAGLSGAAVGDLAEPDNA